MGKYVSLMEERSPVSSTRFMYVCYSSAALKQHFFPSLTVLLWQATRLWRRHYLFRSMNQSALYCLVGQDWTSAMVCLVKVFLGRSSICHPIQILLWVFCSNSLLLDTEDCRAHPPRPPHLHASFLFLITQSILTVLSALKYALLASFIPTSLRDMLRFWGNEIIGRTLSLS